MRVCVWIVTVAVALVCGLPATAKATPEFSSRTEQGCLTCHRDEEGGGALTTTGLRFAAAGYRWPPTGGYRVLGTLRRSVSVARRPAAPRRRVSLVRHDPLRAPDAASGLRLQGPPPGRGPAGPGLDGGGRGHGSPPDRFADRGARGARRQPLGPRAFRQDRRVSRHGRVGRDRHLLRWTAPETPPHGAVAPPDGVYDPVTLAAFDGRDGRPARVAVQGTVYDVSALPRWRGGTHIKHGAGNDLTGDLPRAPHDATLLERAQRVGTLRPDTGPTQDSGPENLLRRGLPEPDAGVRGPLPPRLLALGPLTRRRTRRFPGPGVFDATSWPDRSGSAARGGRP